MLHHSLTKDGKVVDTVAIKRYHTSWRYNGMIITEDEARDLIGKGIHGVIAPWKDIGYQWTIERVEGIVHTIEGRSMEEDGAHCKEGNMNRQSIGICLVGNYNKVDENREPAGSGPPDKEMLIALGRLITRLYDDGAWKPPTIKSYDLMSFIFGHRDFARYKLCPGSAFDIDALKQLAHEYF